MGFIIEENVLKKYVEEGIPNGKRQICDLI